MKRWIHASGVSDEISKETVEAASREIAKSYKDFKCTVAESSEDAAVVKVMNKKSDNETKITLPYAENSYHSVKDAILKAYLKLADDANANQSTYASSRDIEYKIKDYIAAWAKDDVKEGKPMADFRQFKEEMKSEGLKADEDGYDYYVACYNNACSNSNKKVKASSDLHVDADNLCNNIEQLLAKESIPYVFTDIADDRPPFIVVVTYGDWKNDNDRAHDLIEETFNPTKSNWEEVDPADYLDDDVLDSFRGSDNCVVRHEFIWE